MYLAAAMGELAINMGSAVIAAVKLWKRGSYNRATSTTIYGILTRLILRRLAQAMGFGPLNV